MVVNKRSLNGHKSKRKKKKLLTNAHLMRFIQIPSHNPKKKRLRGPLFGHFQMFIISTWTSRAAVQSYKISFTTHTVHPLISSLLLLYSGLLRVLEPSLSVLGERRGYTLDKLPVDLRAQSLKNCRKQNVQKLLIFSPFKRVCDVNGDKSTQGAEETHCWRAYYQPGEGISDLVTSQWACFQKL